MITINEMAANMNVDRVIGHRNKSIKGITADSRTAREGCMFFAVPGNKDDGMFYVNDAVRNGAVCVVLPVSAHGLVNVHKGVTYLFVRDSMKCLLARTAAEFYNRPSEKMMITGVTGTNGKTTVAYLMYAIFKAAKFNPGLISTVEYRDGCRTIPSTMTTPDAIDLSSMLASMITSGCRACSMEVSSHALDQARVDGVMFDAAVFTNLTHDHLDYHETMERYFSAKRRFFELLEHGYPAKRGFAVINRDDKYSGMLIKSLQTPIISYGFSSKSDVRCVKCDYRAGHTISLIEVDGRRMEISSRLVGRHNVSNILASVAAAYGLGIDMDVVQDGLGKMPAIRGRLEKIMVNQSFDVYIDYAHTPDALKNVLVSVKDISKGRLITVFGCGGDRDREKRPLMGKIAKKYSDMVIVTSDNPRTEDPEQIIAEIMEGIKKNGASVQQVTDRSDAIRKALSVARKGDVIVIAGKGHENYQQIGTVAIPYSDHEVVHDFFVQCVHERPM